MTTSSPAPAARRGDRRATRERLLAAAVRLLQEEGESALSTTRLTREVGIVQSGFYNHFPSVDACLAEAAARVVEEVRGPVRAWMAELRESAALPPAQSAELLRAHFRRVLAELVPRWPVLALLERYRRAPGALGGALARAHDGIVSDVEEYLRALAARDGTPAAGRGAPLPLLALLLTDLVLRAAEAVATDPRLDAETAAEVLARTADPMVGGTLEALRVRAEREG